MHLRVIGDVDEAEIELSSSFNFTRGGRESKPPIKYQNMEWKAIHERGKWFIFYTMVYPIFPIPFFSLVFMKTFLTIKLSGLIL